MMSPEERELIYAAQQDPKKIGELYNAYVDRIYRYVYRRTNSVQDTQDLVSEIFLTVLEKINGFVITDVPFICWVYRIAHNKVISWYRKKNKFNVIDLDQQELISDSQTQKIVEDKELEAEIKKHLELLAVEEREIIQLKYFEQLSNKEIALVIGIEPNHVGVKLFRSIRKLRKLLEKQL